MNSLQDKNDAISLIKTQSKNILIASHQAHVQEIYELNHSLVKAKNIICQLNRIHNLQLENLQQAHQIGNQKKKTLIEGLNLELQQQKIKIGNMEENVKQRQSLIEDHKKQIKKLEQEQEILKQQSQEQLCYLQEEQKQNRNIIKDMDETIQLKTKLMEELNNQVQQLKEDKDDTIILSQMKIDELNQQLSQKQKYYEQQIIQLKENLQQNHEKLEYAKKLHDVEKRTMVITISEQIIKIKQLSENEQNYQIKIEQLTCQINLFLQEKLSYEKQKNDQIKKLDADFTQEKKQINQIKLNQENDISVKVNQISKLTQEISGLNNEITNKNDQINDLKIFLQNIQVETQKKQIKINQYCQQSQEQQQIIQQLNVKLKGFQDQNITKVDQKVNTKQQEIVSLIDKPYQIVTQFTKKQTDKCYAISFNREQTIMIAGCGSSINVFEFKQGQLSQKQSLSDHNSDIRTLYFMTKYNQFISGAYMEIGIWSYNNTTQQYYSLQMLKQAHSDFVSRVIMNQNEDLIISCSSDTTIKFWIKKNEWEQLQSLTTGCAMDICLNQSCTQLVSCHSTGYIAISQQGGDQKWTVTQPIKSKYGCRICYINDNLIAFQPKNGKTMETYQLKNKQFIKFQDVSIQNDRDCYEYFPMQFNIQKQLLLNKNGCRINLIRYKNDDFIIEQSINFGTQYIWGSMTDDFQYLVTWDDKSQEFQVMKQK